MPPRNPARFKGPQAGRLAQRSRRGLRAIRGPLLVWPGPVQGSKRACIRSDCRRRGSPAPVGEARRRGAARVVPGRSRSSSEGGRLPTPSGAPARRSGWGDGGRALCEGPVGVDCAALSADLAASGRDGSKAWGGVASRIGGVASCACPGDAPRSAWVAGSGPWALACTSLWGGRRSRSSRPAEAPRAASSKARQAPPLFCASTPASLLACSALPKCGFSAE